MRVEITGSFRERNLKVGGVDFSDMGPEKLKCIIRHLAPHNYHQIPGWIVSGLGDEDCTLILQRERHGTVKTKKVTDCQAMYSVNNFGYRKIYKRILKDIVAYLMDPEAPKATPRAQDHKYHPPALIAIIQFTGLDKALMKSGGCETVEAACNIASLFQHRKHGTPDLGRKSVFIVPGNNFHGRSNRALSFSDRQQTRDKFGPLLENIVHVSYGNLEELRTALDLNKGYVIAFVVEPVQGEGGVIVPPKDYIPGAAKLCKEYDTLLILDEIQTGFGRTGTDWAYERYGILPDLLCAGKAAGGGIVPVSFVAGKAEIMNCIQPGDEGATWSATPIQCIAVTSAIRELSRNNLSERSAKMGSRLLDNCTHLQDMFPDLITDVRGQGLFIGIDTVFDGKMVSQMLLEEGVWAKETGRADAHGTIRTIRLSPPLTITDQQLYKVYRAFIRVFEKLQKSRA